MDLLARLAADGCLNEDASSLLDGGAGEDGIHRQTVVLVGVTGDGKSSTGNTLCNSDIFSVSDGFKSETQEVAHADYLQGGSFWRVIDTIGLHDTDLSQKDVLGRFSAFAERAADGIDAFLFVARWGRFKPEHDAALAAFVANCGRTALQHTIIVFTHCLESQEGLQRALQEAAPASLRDWTAAVREVVGIDNAANDLTTARKAIHGALERLLATNAGLRYGNEALAEARARLAEVEEAEHVAFAAAVAEWRRGGTGPVTLERAAGVVTRPAGSWAAGEVRKADA